MMRTKFAITLVNFYCFCIGALVARLGGDGVRVRVLIGCFLVFVEFSCRPFLVKKRHHFDGLL